MKSKILMFVAVMMILTILIPSAMAADVDVDEKYSITESHAFDIVPGTEEWDSYDSALQRMEACHVSEDELRQMTTEALYETVLNYPLLVNIFAYDNLETGIAVLSKEFAGIEELMSRDDMMEVVSSHSLSLHESDGEDLTMRKIYEKALVHYANSLNDKTYDSKSLARRAEKKIYTPNNTPVFVFVDSTWEDQSEAFGWPLTQEEEELVCDEFLDIYSTATLLRGPNPKYNCHSYAWYSTSSNNRYWMDWPDDFWLDGSYVRCSQKLNAKVTYMSYLSYNYLYPEHSGIVTKISGSPRITSKWSYNGLFSHAPLDCPYVNSSTEDLYYWELA